MERTDRWKADMPEAQDETLDLIKDQKLVLTQRPTGSIIRIVGRDGQVSLKIEVNEQGPVLRFKGANLAIETNGDLSICAKRLELHAQDQVVIGSGGNAAIQVHGDFSTAARTQTICAELGNVNVRANDDVTLDGERIRMNC